MTEPSPMPVRVVTLPHAEERRRRIGALLDGLELAYEFFPGVDGRRLSDAERDAAYDRGKQLRMKCGYTRPLRGGQIGCSLSHLALYREVLARGWPGLMVFEDDAAPGPSLPAALAALARRFAADDPAVVLFTPLNWYYRRSRRRLAGGLDLVRVHHAAFTSAYFVTRAGAEAMAAACDPVWTAADDWPLLRRFVPVYGLDPYLVEVDRFFGSDIAGDGDPVEAQWRRDRRRMRLRPDVMLRRAARAARNWADALLAGGVRRPPPGHFRP